jgi:hypothetical protein
LDVFVVVISVDGITSTFGGVVIDALVEAADFAADFVMDIIPLSSIGTASNVLSSALASAEMEVLSTHVSPLIQLYSFVSRKKERSRSVKTDQTLSW